MEMINTHQHLHIYIVAITKISIVHVTTSGNLLWGFCPREYIHARQDRKCIAIDQKMCATFC